MKNLARVMATLTLCVLATTVLAIGAEAHPSQPGKTTRGGTKAHSLRPGKTTQGTNSSDPTYGPFPSPSPDLDSGTCGTSGGWASDTFKRSFSVNKGNPNTVSETFTKGTFVTIAAPSPNACVIQAAPNGNGNKVTNGIAGTFSGSDTIQILTGTFNPKAKCTASTCNTRDQFVHTVYGASATYDVPTFEFDYYTQKNGSWHNASSDSGGNQGDITKM